MSRVRNDEQYEFKRAQILGEAAKLIRRKGYNTTTMEDVASSLGVTKAAVYYYYKKKQDILLEICERALDKAIEQIEADDDTSDPRERLSRLIRHHLEILAENIEEFTVFFQEIDVRMEPQARRVRARQRAFSQKLEEIIEQGIGDGVFRKVDSHLVALGIIGMCNSMYRWYRIEEYDIRDVTREFVELIEAGLLVPTT